MNKAEYEAAIRADKAKGNWPDVVAGYIKTILSAVGPVQWEYTILWCKNIPGENARRERLNEEGAKGWELVAVVRGHNEFDSPLTAVEPTKDAYVMKRLVRNRKSQGTDHE